MFVLIDADKLSVQTHLGELDTALIAANQPKLDPANDPIARLIPKWSIETWILYLVSRGASERILREEESYKDSKTNEQWSELIPDAAATLFEWTRQTAVFPENLLDSLRHGIQEIPRALPKGR